MPLKTSRSFLMEGPSGRKRSHDQISRSESRSESPWYPPRAPGRTSATPSLMDVQDTHSFRSRPPPRYAGDGFDYRRPVMASNSASPSLSPSHSQTPPPLPPVIDLTSDPDSPPAMPPPPTRSFSPSSGSGRSRLRPEERLRIRLEEGAEGRSRSSTRSATQHSRAPGRAPRFGRNIMSGTPELIDLSHVNDEIEDPPDPPSYSRRLPPPIPSLPHESSTGSSDVEFVSSRPIPPAVGTTLPADRRSRAAPTYPFQPFVNGVSQLRDLIMNGTAFMAGGRHGPGAGGASRTIRGDHAFQEEVQRITAAVSNHHGVRPHQDRDADIRMLPAPVIMAEDFEALAFDYTRPAFAVGGFIDGEAGSSTPDRRPSPPYKPPPAAAEGFTRKIEEEDVVICVNCSDELGTGDGEVKRQVWIAKGCGHGYCGECATNRAISKSANKKDKRLTSRNVLPFKTCQAPGCDKSVSAKTFMIQIYL